MSEGDCLRPIYDAHPHASIGEKCLFAWLLFLVLGLLGVGERPACIRSHGFLPSLIIFTSSRIG